MDTENVKVMRMDTKPLSAQGPPRGEAHVNSKLTEELVRRIRSLHAEGYGYDRIAQAIGISKPTVQKIVKRKLWAHVE